MTVFLVVGRFMVAVIGMVTAPPPQLKVMTPPFPTAVLSAVNVQLAAVPVPITLVGLDTSAGCPLAGTPALHDPFGLPAWPAPPPVPVVPPVPGVPPVPVVPPLAWPAAPPLDPPLPVVPPLAWPAVPPVAPTLPPVAWPAAPPLAPPVDPTLPPLAWPAVPPLAPPVDPTRPPSPLLPPLALPSMNDELSAAQPRDSTIGSTNTNETRMGDLQIRGRDQAIERPPTSEGWLLAFLALVHSIILRAGAGEKCVLALSLTGPPSGPRSGLDVSPETLIPHEADENGIGSIVRDHHAVWPDHQLIGDGGGRPIGPGLRRDLELCSQVTTRAGPGVHRVDVLRRSPNQRLRRLAAVDAPEAPAQIGAPVNALAFGTVEPGHKERCAILVELRVAVRMLQAREPIWNRPARATVAGHDRARTILRDCEPRLPRREGAARVDKIWVPRDPAGREPGAAQHLPGRAAVDRFHDPVRFVQSAHEVGAVVGIDLQRVEADAEGRLGERRPTVGGFVDEVVAGRPDRRRRRSGDSDHRSARNVGKRVVDQRPGEAVVGRLPEARAAPPDVEIARPRRIAHDAPRAEHVRRWTEHRGRHVAGRNVDPKARGTGACGDARVGWKRRTTAVVRGAARGRQNRCEQKAADPNRQRHTVDCTCILPDHARRTSSSCRCLRHPPDRLSGLDARAGVARIRDRDAGSRAARPRRGGDRLSGLGTRQLHGA